ncbi:MAG TPA: autotransporter-associated beta strand repeat-containing protein, partial [Chitinispirillaceae bacterium]|nr:autotransporter-associated beta strand repeat-containing protein [Chitinispirillaceae bacterium]
GAINVGPKNGIYVASEKIAIVGTIIKGASNLSKYGEGTLALAGNSDFTGTMFINAGTLELGYGGSTGGINGSIFNNGILIDTRADTSSIDTAVSGPGKFLKKGTGILALNGINTYTGSTMVSAGKLIVNGSINKSSSVSVATGAVLSGTGTCSGLVTINDGTVDPGSIQSGKLSIGELRLNENSILHFDLGVKSDTISVDGTLVLDGIVNFSTLTELPVDTFRIITYSGPLINNTLKTGSIPAGLDCKLIFGNGFIDAVFTDGLIKTEPNDTIIPAGTSAFFTVVTSGENSLAYKWLRAPSDSVGNTPSYTTGPVTIAHNGSRFCCVVRDGDVIDSSRWAELRVIDTPRIVLQPQNVSVAAGIQTVFSISVKDTVQVIYSWRKAGNNSEIGSLNSLTINATTFSDSGDYFCIVSNPAGSCKSNVVHLTVRPDNILTAAFSFAPKRGLAPLNVVFTDNSTGDITSHLWMFGDNNSSTDVNPMHIYAKAGIYTVTLVVTGPQGSNTIVKTDSVYVYSKEINQEIITFFDTNIVDDTISAFTGRVLLWKDSSCLRTGNNKDTLATISFTSLPAGLVPVGLPISIRTNAAVAPFYIGFLIDSLPEGTSISNVRIYSYIDNKFYVNYASQFDSINGIVYARVVGSERTFIPMIDTIAPNVTVYSNPATPVLPGIEVNDVIGITDNVANVRWKYFYGSGNTLPVLSRQGIINSNETILSF